MSSWLSGLANKAEDMLNSVDKAAATTLTKNNPSKPDPHSQWKPSTTGSTVTSPNAYLSQVSRSASQANASAVRTKSEGSIMTSSSSVPSNLNKMNTDQTGAMSRSMYAQSSSKKRDSDEELFEFLNSPDSKDNGTGSNNASGAGLRRPSGARVDNLTNGHSRQSSTSSVGSHRSAKTPEAPAVITFSEVSDLKGSSPSTPDQSTSTSPDEGRASPKALQMNHEENTTPQNKSSLELENQLLKNEVSSLNQEMTSVIRRAKESQEELTRVRRKLDSQSSQMSRQDSIVRELQSRESDLTEALGAKDSQLAVLRVRFEESEKELQQMKKRAGDLEQERHRILNDHTSVSGAQSQALDGLKQKLADAEEALKREKESYSRAQQESMGRQSKVETELQSVAESLKGAERKAAEEKTRSTEMATKLRAAKAQADSAKQELTDYKDKAARILQSKDRLIASLKEGSGEAGDTQSVTQAELESARQERDMLREEVQQSQMTLESLRTEIQDLELTLQTEQEAALDTQRHMQESLDSERERREDSEQEVRRQKQELQYAREELINQKTGHQRQMQDRDTEIDRLRNQLTTRSANSSSQVELENRLHTLTESLIHKQTVVEALSTEKNSLVLQLERLEQQHQLLQDTTQRVNTTAVHMHDDDEVRQRLPGFMRESPLDGDVARRVKRAANSIDKFSVRLGVFLRRYPIARVFVICYMVLLHLWVMIVLLTYQPEMHTHDYAPQAP